MKLDRNGLHFTFCPRLDTFSDDHPWLFVLVLAVIWTVLCLAAAGIWLMLTI